MKKILREIWDYFRSGWEGDDGKMSYRRITQYVFIYLFIHLIVTGAAMMNEYGFKTFLVCVLGYFFIAGLITAQQLLMAFKYMHGASSIQEESPKEEHHLDDEEPIFENRHEQ